MSLFDSNKKIFIKEIPTRRVFLLGKSRKRNNFSPFDKDPFRIEAAKFQDILVGDFYESFYNLTLKEALLLKWYKSECQTKFIFKGQSISGRFKYESKCYDS